MFKLHTIKDNLRQKEDYKKYIGVNLSEPVDHFTEMFFTQNKNQFWVPDEISVPLDLPSWEKLTQDERNTYEYALAGLTMLDTIQGNIGMPEIARVVEDEQRGAVLYFMAAMENIHAESYSTIFQTLSSKERRHELFKWIESHSLLQKKANDISKFYEALDTDDSPMALYKALVASVFLESFLFYSGFYYPLYLAGNGRMTTSGEIIRKILLDESIHGVFTGLDAQVLKAELSQEEQDRADKEMYELLNDLYENEVAYTKDLYDQIGLTDDVVNYLQYNANKALANLGFDPYFEEKGFNPIIENALDTTTKNHDFFSVKGDGYVLALNVEPLRDEDFVFED